MTDTEIALTQLSHGAGCACKLPANLLSQALASLPSAAAPDALLVGNSDLDDAAVWQIDERTALVQTVDFFTPIVDDPHLFGRIAASNAFSDVYAMGGTPALALNIVAFPKSLDPGILAQILRGGADVAAEAGAVVAGGHSIDDPEPKYGMVVTGFVDPRAVWTNAGARPGDAVVLGKPIGTGVVTTALKHGVHCPESEAAAIASMTTLNAAAAAELRPHSPHAVTDVTGFGLVGHARELAAGAGVCVQLHASAVPLLAGVRELAEAGHVPGGSRTNLELAADYARFDAGVSAVDRELLCDAQTSGGLLAALDPAAARELGWAIVGRVVEGPAGTVEIR